MSDKFSKDIWYVLQKIIDRQQYETTDVIHYQIRVQPDYKSGYTPYPSDEQAIIKKLISLGALKEVKPSDKYETTVKDYIKVMTMFFLLQGHTTYL